MLLLQHAHHGPQELPSFQQEEGQLPQLRIFVVGTFKDQLVEEDRLMEAVQDISRRLKELKGKPYYHCIRKDPVGQPCYLINNMADKEDDRADVNSFHEHLSSTRSSLKLKVPVMWYICKQITQGTSQKLFRFQDLKNGGKLLLYLSIYMKGCRAECGIYKEYVY